MLHTTMFLGYVWNVLSFAGRDMGPWRVVEHVNGWCFRGIYKGGLWENDLHVSAHFLDQSRSS